MQSGEAITAESISETGLFPVFGGHGLRGFTDTFTHHGEFVLIGRQGAHCGNVRTATGRFWASEHAVVTTVMAGHNARWLMYLLHAMNLNQYSVSAAQPGLAVDRIRSLAIPVPPYPLQHRIADFLDRKTAAIDELIAKKERLALLLQEKRQAVITQAVTKGLDPGVGMKESGLPWAPEIPEVWRVVRLKHLAQIRTGIALGREVRGELVETRPYLRVANVQNGYLDLRDVNTIEVTNNEAIRFSLMAGDVLMNEGGDNDKLGRGYVWEGQIPGCLHQNHVFAVRLHAAVSPLWVNYATQADYLRDFFLSRAKQSTNLASISATNLGDAPIILPPDSLIPHLVEQLTERIAKLGASRDAVDRSINAFREYRQSLITAAVTGKIDVGRDERAFDDKLQALEASG